LKGRAALADVCKENQIEILGIIADRLSKTGWSLGWVSAVDPAGRTIWIADAHREDGKRFVVHAEEKLTAFLELEAAILGGNYAPPAAHEPESCLDCEQQCASHVRPTKLLGEFC